LVASVAKSVWYPIVSLLGVAEHGRAISTSLLSLGSSAFSCLNLRHIACAAMTCRFDIAGWSTSPGALATWNLARQGGDSSPNVWLELEEGLTALAFHPTAPVGAGGATAAMGAAMFPA
jgi:hypothetical protein